MSDALNKEPPCCDGLKGVWVRRLAHGENPYQQPADQFADPDSTDPWALHRFAARTENAPCYTNLADADALVTTLAAAAAAFLENFGRIPFLAVAAKHGNACGAAFDADDPAAAVEGALWGNPRAIWGGEFITNCEVTEDLARRLFESEARKARLGKRQWLLDMVIAPGFSGAAVAILSQRKGVKLFENPALAGSPPAAASCHHRPVRGGILRQPAASFVFAAAKADWVPTPLEGKVLGSLLLGWAAAFTANVGGNEVALAREGRLLGLGGGPSTVDAVETALHRARAVGHDVCGAVFSADAFFPFTDAPQLLIDAGCAAGCVPSGGQAFAQVRACLEKAGVAMAYLAPEIRGFCRH